MVSPKRSLSPAGDEEPHPKRSRYEEVIEKPYLTLPPLASSTDLYFTNETDSHRALVSELPNLHHQSRKAVQRSIALVLKHDGFDSATPEALESFTQLVETYLGSMIEDVKKFALASRRDRPNPVDFDKMLRRHNVPVASLKPHLRPPISKAAVSPEYAEEMASLDDGALTTLPLLDQELSGEPDKDAKPYIPTSFPDFPSRHTYKFTPQDDVNVRDSKTIREQAARTAQQGEDALRRLVRASKMRKQKEVKSLVERDVHGKERFRLWELTMKRFMGADGRGEATDQIGNCRS